MLSVKKVLLGQLYASLAIAGFWLIWVIVYDSKDTVPVVWSSLAGGLSVFLPAAFSARIMQYLRLSVLGWVVSEVGKIVLTLALLVLFLREYSEVRWLPLLTTYLLVLQTYWLALVWK